MCYCFQFRILFNFQNFQKSLKVSIQDGFNPGIFISRPLLLLYSFAFPPLSSPAPTALPTHAGPWSLLNSLDLDTYGQETATALLQLICPELKESLAKSWERKLNILRVYPGPFASWEKKKQNNPSLSFRPTGQYIGKIALAHSGKTKQNKMVASCFLLSSLSSSRWNSGEAGI